MTTIGNNQPPVIQARTEGALRKVGVNTSDGVTRGELAKLDKSKDGKLDNTELANVAPEDRSAVRAAFEHKGNPNEVVFHGHHSSVAGTAAKHTAGVVLENGVHHGAHLMAHGSKIAARAVPGVGAAVNGYFAYQNISHAKEAGERGNAGAAVSYALAGAIDGTSAVINAVGTATGVGTLISTPVNLVLGGVSTGLSVLGSYLDD